MCLSVSWVLICCVLVVDAYWILVCLGFSTLILADLILCENAVVWGWYKTGFEIFVCVS